MDKIFQNIRKIRTVKGYSQQNMADELGISQRHYGRIENGDVDISYSTLCKIASTLGIKINHLIGDGELTGLNAEGPHQEIIKDHTSVELENITRLYERIIEEKNMIINLLQKPLKGKNKFGGKLKPTA